MGCVGDVNGNQWRLRSKPSLRHSLASGAQHSFTDNASGKMQIVSQATRGQRVWLSWAAPALREREVGSKPYTRICSAARIVAAQSDCSISSGLSSPTYAGPRVNRVVGYGRPHPTMNRARVIVSPRQLQSSGTLLLVLYEGSDNTFNIRITRTMKSSPA